MDNRILIDNKDIKSSTIHRESIEKLVEEKIKSLEEQLGVVCDKAAELGIKNNSIEYQDLPFDEPLDIGIDDSCEKISLTEID